LKNCSIYLLAAIILATAIAIWVWHAGRPLICQIATPRNGPTLEQAESLSCLVSSRVDVSDVREVRLEGLTGGMKIVLLVRGDYLMGVDLSQAHFELLDNSARTAVLDLPQPRATSPRVDHERTKVFSLQQTGLWQLAPAGGGTYGYAVDESYKKAQQSVGHSRR
jgi:hypothetical protein